MSEKFKFFLLNDHLFFGLIIILVGIGSFSLGRASVLDIKVENAAFPQVQAIEPAAKTILDMESQKAAVSASGILEEIIASKSGTKYHLASCAGAKQIKPANKITFPSRQAAEAAGYKPAANCPQLQ